MQIVICNKYNLYYIKTLFLQHNFYSILYLPNIHAVFELLLVLFFVLQLLNYFKEFFVYIKAC